MIDRISGHQRPCETYFRHLYPHHHRPQSSSQIRRNSRRQRDRFLLHPVVCRSSHVASTRMHKSNSMLPCNFPGDFWREKGLAEGDVCDRIAASRPIESRMRLFLNRGAQDKVTRNETWHRIAQWCGINWDSKAVTAGRSERAERALCSWGQTWR